MSRLKNLYTYLISNRRSDVDGWLSNYLDFTRDVDFVRKALEGGSDFKANDTYKKTVFSGDKAWQAFVDQLIRLPNGVTGKGQSVLSLDNLSTFLSDDHFVTALAELIKTPDEPTFTKFVLVWNGLCDKLKAKRNPLLVNRTLAACTLNVTSTVNESSFESVYGWLMKEGLISSNPASPQTNWYQKNVYLMNFLRNEFKVELQSRDTNEHLLSIFVWELYANIANPFSLKKQVVKYGAPGTGKTYTAKLSTNLLFDIWREEFGMESKFTRDTCCQTVQFHPSFGYEDFMEGLRPRLDSAGNAQLTLQNGIFKRFCIDAGAWEKDVYAIPECGRRLSGEWLSTTVENLEPYREHLKGPHWTHVFSLPDKSKKVSGAVPPFFFIIDEINRAELSRVLGELMICLEYRGTNSAIFTQYAGLNTADTGMLAVDDGFKFFIPHNVYVIGTMNTIDRSVESFDLALRRRFRWERTDPDIVALRYDLKERDAKRGRKNDWVGLADDLEKLNSAIAKTDILGEDYQIGHAYLMNLSYSADLSRSQVREKVWEDNIQPLLEEYLRGSGRSSELMLDFKNAFCVS